MKGYSQCPVPGCQGTRRTSQVACEQHWYRLPDILRGRIWMLYRSEPGGIAHTEAIREALTLLK